MYFRNFRENRVILQFVSFTILQDIQLSYCLLFLHAEIAHFVVYNEDVCNYYTSLLETGSGAGLGVWSWTSAPPPPPTPKSSCPHSYKSYFFCLRYVAALVALHDWGQPPAKPIGLISPRWWFHGILLYNVCDFYEHRGQKICGVILSQEIDMSYGNDFFSSFSYENLLPYLAMPALCLTLGGSNLPEWSAVNDWTSFFCIG